MSEEGDSMKRIGELIEKILDDYKKGSFSDLANSLIELTSEIEKNIPEILPIVDGLLGEIGSGVLQPIIDEMVKQGIKMTEYLNEKGAEYYQGTLATAEKYKKSKASYLFAEIEALQSAGFTRPEAMKILLMEMSTKNRNSAMEQATKTIDSVIESRKKELPESEEKSSFENIFGRF